MPLIIGCVMAYVINILMNFYEKWYTKLFQVEVAKNIKRIVCLCLAFLSLGGIVFLVVNIEKYLRLNSSECVSQRELVIDVAFKF